MLSDGERRLIEQYSPLGVSLFARNIESRSQLAELTRQIREAAEDENIIIAVDQEGGRVRRLAEPEFRPYASQYVLGKIGETYGQEEAEKAVYEHVLLISKDLKDCGINMNFAPVLDLAFEETAAVSAMTKRKLRLTAKLWSKAISATASAPASSICRGTAGLPPTRIWDCRY